MNYILTVIDVFSKYAWFSLLEKTGNEITQAFQKIFKGRKPERLQTDKGTEFINKQTQELFKKHNVHWFATENETKAQIVERFNRTLKERMYKYFTAKKTNRWLNVLSEFVNNYNTSYHRSIRMTPVEASKKKNESAVWENLYGEMPTSRKPAFKIGDTVRIFRLRGKFKRGYTANYTDEIFTISTVLATNPPTYRIVDGDGEEIKGTFYEEELSKFSTS